MSAKFHLPKINLSRAKTTIVVFLLIISAFSCGYLLGFKGYRGSFKNITQISISREIPADKSNVDFSLFWKVWDNLSSNYFDKSKLDPRKMVYGAISGMVAAIGDPYTVFLSPEDNKIVQEDLQGSFEGVGIQIGFKGKQLAVVAPLPGSPAEKAGIRAGDLIIAIKDEKKAIDKTTEGMSLPEAVQIIRGPAKSKITLALIREGEGKPITVDIVREDIKVPSVIVKFVGKDESIAHIHLLKFVAETDGEWEAAVKEVLKKPNVSGIILDVRNNPGGYLQGAVDIAGEFLKNGSLVVYEEKSNGTRNEFKTERFPRLSKYPLAVLVNEGSASASEILAGALSETLGVKIVGEKTFGKGTIQEPKQVNGGAGLHITVAKWLTPKGNWVNEKGLKPDVEISDNTETTEDEQLNKAIEVLTSKN